jgi:hypothetical protein
VEFETVELPAAVGNVEARGESHRDPGLQLERRLDVAGSLGLL